MDYAGILTRFKVNRLLTEAEEREKLPQNRSQEAEPLPRKAVIRMNSNILEICDKFIFDRGGLTAFGIYSGCIFAASLIFIICLTIVRDEWGDTGMLLLNLLVISISIPILFVSIRYFIFRECFCYTHYPIIFNRKTRKVHVFRFDGTVMTEDWDKLFFTLGEEHGLGTNDIRGHRLAEDGKTVLETFALPYYDIRLRDTFFATWEFIRQFMEDKDSPARLTPMVDSLLGIDKKRLSYWQALMLAYEFDRKTADWYAWLTSPVNAFFCIGRWIADRTSKIPKWPAEIAAELVPEPNDPYVVSEERMKKAQEKLTALPAQ